MRLKELSFIMLDAVSKGADEALQATHVLPDTLTKAQAYGIYGRSNVDRWILEGLIHPVKKQNSGSKKFIDRLKLEAVARASNRSSYLPVADR